MKDGALLHVEYIAETDAKATVDIRAAILPDALCTGDALPKYLPKNAFRSPNKLESGQCSVTGKPFIVRSVTLEPAQILKRHDVTLLTLSKSGEKKQLPFLIEKNGYAWGYNFSNVEPSPVTPAPGLGLQAFPLDSTMETIQTVDVNGKREILLPSQNIFRKWLRLDPRVGLYYTPLLPTANINLLNFGPLGFTLENSIAIPEMSFLPLKKYSLRLRGGINVGYHTFAQELYQNNLAVADGHIMLLPVLLQATLYWDLKPKNMKLTVSPYLRLADGIVFSTVSTQLKPQYVSLLNPANANDVSRSGSYIGNGFGASLGVELKPESWSVA
ncbi:MAG TPA: hypothetical protein PLY93_02205, partial [Turneriella sp.]|nr:hypothetical protein [Turneriella sp.]